MGGACRDLRGRATLVMLRVVPSDDEPNVEVGRNRKGHPTQCIFQHGTCHLFGWSHPGLDCEAESRGCPAVPEPVPTVPTAITTTPAGTIEIPDLPEFLRRTA
jgi:hypothetical protein